jgi:hypothetical protein
MARSESHRHASKVGRAFGARTTKASAAVRLPSCHPRANRIVTEAPGPYTVACDGDGNSALAARQTIQTPHTPTRTGQRRGKLDIFHIVGAR